MAQETIGQNITFEIYNADGTPFHDLVMRKATYDSVVMSLGDKITGDVYYKDNTLAVTMQEYIEYKRNPNDENEDPVRYVLVNPPTIVREGMASDNSELKGMTKYSFTFYHPMYMLANFPFSDVAVSPDQQRYLSENKTFYWIGNLVDYVAKLNKNLERTEWCVEIGITVPSEEQTKLSEVLTFDKQTIADALKTGYETWEVPYVIDTIDSTDSRYAQGKRFLVHFGLPSEEILVENEQHKLVPYVFRFGKGVGLKNNSRTPRNNKIVTRISGYGSEDNIPYGYPQIPWTGDQTWKYTINNDSTDIHSYPIYDGIVSGQRVKLIKHPFTRTHLMPSIYHDCVNRKVNPYATGYDPTIELKDYYDADNTYDNPINPVSPSCEIHEFEKIKPELVSRNLVAVTPLSQQETKSDYQTMSDFLSWLENIATQTNIDIERSVLHELYSRIQTQTSWSYDGSDEDLYWCKTSFTKDAYYAYVKFESANINFTATVLTVAGIPTTEWDDTMDDDGKYLQSYFQVTIPQLDFDVYACAAVTEEMVINMRSGACLGCSFPVEVDWDDYKKNFYDEDGNFAPDGDQRDLQKYPNSRTGSITLTLKKETETFGTLMPNIYQQPRSGDQFVILGISLPTTYITNAEERLDADMKQYMRDNNVYYFDYPLKFDEHFLATHTGILEQMKPNIVVQFEYAGTVHALYIKQMSVKFGQSPLPQYDITLTDDIEIVLNPIGRVTDEVSNLRILLGQGGGGLLNDNRYLRKDKDDTAQGFIRFIKGLQVGERFVTGLLGEGGVFRKNDDGTTYIETDKLYVRMKAYFDSVEVKHYLHSGGNRIASKAGINCVRVEYIDSNGEITTDVEDAVKFRCYFKAEEDDKSITNDFVIGDLAFCQETNVDVKTIDMHRYWRAVVGKSSSANANGEHYIDLSATDCEAGSDVPIAQDDIIQLGNKTDTTRQGAIVEFVGGEDAPSYQIFQGINTYSLSGKNYVGLGYNSGTGRAYLNVYGDTFIGAMPDEHGVSSTYIKYNAGTRSLEIKAKIDAQSTIDGETLAEFIAQNTWTEEQIDALITAETDPMSDAIEDIKRQVDGNITTWFYDGEPTLQNLPASGWTTADDKNEHLGDLYYDNLTGYAYRFKYDDLNRQWSWIRITDVDVTKALADAAKAQDTADHKRRIFVVQPTPPYDQGDLWVNATYPSGNTETNAAQNKYYNDFLRCNTDKASGTSFAIADWGLASKYTDDQALLDFKANQYVQQLTNGTLNQGISNAQSAASQAALDAAAAQAAADNAQTDADAANDRLDDWADDGVISPTEKTSLKVDWEDMKKEYVQICNDADKYNVSKTAFTSAYTSANAAFQKYTASTPENITIGSDYANIAAYYAARQTIMDAISVAAKKVATDAQAAADAAGNTASSALTAAQAADAHAAAFDAIKQALHVDNRTIIDGGLVLSTLIALRDSSGTLWSGISGAYSTIGAYGGGLAAWFGGDFIDRRNSDGTWNNVGAKVGFRFDGSGYVAGGAISWDATGLTKVTASKISALEIDLNGDEVATENWVSDNFVSITFFERLFQAYNGSTIVHPNSTSTIDNIKAMFGFWTEQYISALGKGSGGSSGGVTMAQVWSALGNATTEQINATHLTNALSSYNPTSNFKTINGNSIIGTGNITIESSGGTVTAVKVGTTTYNPASGVVSLPAYPSAVSQLTNDSGFITSSGSCNYATSAGNANMIANNITVTGTSTADNGISFNDGTRNMFFGNGASGNSGIFTPTKGWIVGLNSSGAAFLNGNATSATQLRTARTIWGQSFDGSGNVSGAISGATTISASGKVSGDSCQFGYIEIPSSQNIIESLTGHSLHLNFYRSANVSICCGGGNVGIGTTSPAEKLHVSGNAKATKFIGALEGNADTATTLKTARTLWGQSFDGSGNVSGSLSSVANISFDKSGRNIGSIAYFDTTNSRLGIGTSSPSYKLDVAGTFYASGNSSIGGELGVTGTMTVQSIEIGHTNEINATGSSTLYLQFRNTGNLVLCMNGKNVGIGTDSPSQKLHVSGNIYATGAVTCLSDIREKNILGQTEITVEQIARMPSIVYRWKGNGDDRDEHVGSIAQDWQKTLPQVVLTAKDEKKTLSMQYGVASLVSAITIARKVVDHERRIAELERENKELKLKLKIA